MFTLIRPLFPYLRRYRRDFFWGGLSIVLSNAIAVLFPLVVAMVIDGLNTGVTKRKILIYSGMLLGVTVGKGVFLFLSRLIIIGISRDIEFDLRNDLFAQLEKQSASYYQEQPHRRHHGPHDQRPQRRAHAARPGHHVHRQHGALLRRRALFPAPHQPLPDPRRAASHAPGQHPHPVMGRKIHERFERIQAMFSDISAQAQENFSGARLVRAFAQEEAQIEAFESSNREYIRRALRLVRLMGMLWPTLEFMLGLAMVITLLVGGHEVLTHRIAIGDFVAFNTYMVMLTWPIIALGWVVNLFQRGTASVVRIHELLTAEAHHRRPRRRTPAVPTDLKLRGDIEFRDLHFRLPLRIHGTRPVEVLHGISLRIPAGSSLALVGPTGSGKSTLVSLIPRLYDAPPGAVLIDGRPIRDYPPRSPARRNIGFVPQETFLFSDDHPRKHRLRRSQGAPTKKSAAPPKPPTSATNSTSSPTASRPRSANAASRSPAAKSSAPRSPAPSSATPASSSSTTPSPASTPTPKNKSSTNCAASCADAPPSSSPTASPPCATPTTSRCWSRPHRRTTARHDELLARNGYYASLFQKQLLEEELAVVG